MDSNQIDSKYTQNFEELLKQAEADPALKKEVFSTMERIQRFAEVLDLFTVKFLESEATLFGHILKSDK